MPARIMFVEDDLVLRGNYADALKSEGFIVETFADRNSALERLQEQQPDLALLDISLGSDREGGFQLCQDIRRINEKIPIVFLTSHEKDADKISGMRMGADDYLVKDISLDYLVVRISALLKRLEVVGNKEEDDRDVMRRGDLVIDTEGAQVWWKDEIIELSLTQFNILVELVLKPGQVKSASKLMTAANIVVETNTISAHIKSIRKQFKVIDPGFECLRTEYGHGYRWVDVAH